MSLEPRGDTGFSDARCARVAIVVVLYTSGPHLRDFVASLAAGLGGVEFELIAVDNASPDDSAGLMQELAPEATIVRTGRNGGYAAGINAGVAAAAEHSAVLVVNPDVRLEPGCVRELASRLRRTGVGITVPRLVDADGQIIDSMRREPTVRRAWGDAILGAQRAGRWPTLGEIVSDRHEYEREQLTDWAEGSTQLISSDCWQACGDWDESFFLYSEETDYNLRARDRGFTTLYVPTARATHLAGGSGVSDALWVMQVTNRIRFFRRRRGRGASILYWLATLMREATRALLGRSNSRAATRALLSLRRLRETPDPKTLK